MTRMLNRRATARALARNPYDVVHATLYDPTLLAHIGRAKLVITVHDMVPELMPQAVGGLAEDFSRCKNMLIAKADGVDRHLWVVGAGLDADVAAGPGGV